jgi:hypothetical protein
MNHPHDHREHSHAALHEVTVTYPAAREPFREHDVQRSESVGSLKVRVLDAFHLTEGTSPEGTTTTYTLYHGKKPLEDLGQTLGAVAGDAHELHLKLVQEIKHG